MPILDKIKTLKFNEQGLIPVITQDHTTKQVLMLAWMNEEALLKTLNTKDVWYWSRSRNCLWRKGETSGHTQTLVKAHIDCDQDTLLIEVEQMGPACHTGKVSCFFTPF